MRETWNTEASEAGGGSSGGGGDGKGGGCSFTTDKVSSSSSGSSSSSRMMYQLCGGSICRSISKQGISGVCLSKANRTATSFNLKSSFEC
ncbi:hypothetical protein M0802_004873 [Mischocyttarus mexicanus]|nr:hypothetical protein M0802_004873 [Mischocyttarus mexicanus]